MDREYKRLNDYMVTRLGRRMDGKAGMGRSRKRFMQQVMKKVKGKSYQELKKLALKRKL